MRKRDREKEIEQADDAWKAFSTTDVLAIGHDIVYRYIHCRHRLGREEARDHAYIIFLLFSYSLLG